MIESRASAAAPLGQVHKANIVSTDPSQAVCVKIQYPGIADAIDDDFRNVMQMLSLARWVQSGRQLDALTKELKMHLMHEVNYEYERQTAEKVSDFLSSVKRYKVPHYYTNLCTDKVLTITVTINHNT